jgi:hypothetical protein
MVKYGKIHEGRALMDQKDALNKPEPIKRVSKKASVRQKLGWAGEFLVAAELLKTTLANFSHAGESKINRSVRH